MTYNNVEVQEKDGSVAVLISKGYGAGWSTWGCKVLAYDKKVIELFDKYPPMQSHDMLEIIQNKLAEIGYPHVYMGGYNQLEKQWIPKGVSFRIREYDGSESIEILGQIDFICFN